MVVCSSSSFLTCVYYTSVPGDPTLVPLSAEIPGTFLIRAISRQGQVVENNIKYLFLTKGLEEPGTSSPGEESPSLPSNSWEKPPDQTSCLHESWHRQSHRKAGWFEWPQMFFLKPQPGIAFKQFYFAVISLHITQMLESGLQGQHVLKDDNCK